MGVVVVHQLDQLQQQQLPSLRRRAVCSSVGQSRPSAAELDHVGHLRPIETHLDPAVIFISLETHLEPSQQ